MRRSLRCKGAIGAILGMVFATLAVLLPASPVAAVSQTNACQNSATPNATQLDTDLVGTAPASVSPGEQFTLSGVNLSLFLPGDLFVVGYNLNLLNNGDVIPGDVRVVIEGTNTVEGTQSTNTASTSVGPINISDPDGQRSTGDETADPVNVSQAFDNQTWTAGPSGTISFREDTVPLGVDQGGIVLHATVGGIITVQFRCSPGTVTPPDPGVITLIDPAATFATTTITGTPTTTAPTTTAPTTTTPTTTAPTTTAPTTTAPTTTAPTTTPTMTTAPTTTTAPTPVALPPPAPVRVQPIFTG
jgi:hypothetical protein